MKVPFFFGLIALAALSRPALAQTNPGTTPSTTIAPGVPINPANPTAPVINNGTIVPGQPGATPPIATPPGTVYSAPSTKKMPARKRTTKPAKATRPAM